MWFKSERSLKVGKFLISGGSAALVEYIVFIILSLQFGMVLWVANVLSFIAGLITSFLLNRNWVFKSRGDTKKKFLKYLMLAFINLCLSTLLLSLLVQMLHAPSLFAKVFVMGVIATWNFFIFSKLIFTEKEIAKG